MPLLMTAHGPREGLIDPSNPASDVSADTEKKAPISSETGGFVRGGPIRPLKDQISARDGGNASARG